MKTEEERFRDAVPKSMPAVNAFANYLNRRGTDTIVNQVTVRPRFDERDAHGDTEDIKARRPGGDWLRIEVKGRLLNFTGRHDFPYPSIIADRTNKKSAPADWYVTISKNMEWAAIMDGAQIDRWQRGTVYDRTKGYECPVYFCPLGLVRFVRISAALV
jgi:hypothetical protein